MNFQYIVSKAITISNFKARLLWKYFFMKRVNNLRSETHTNFKLFVVNKTHLFLRYDVKKNAIQSICQGLWNVFEFEVGHDYGYKLRESVCICSLRDENNFVSIEIMKDKTCCEKLKKCMTNTFMEHNLVVLEEKPPKPSGPG